MQFHRRLLRRQYAGIKGGRESTSTTGMFAIYYFHISPFFLFQFPHLFLSGGQISNAPKHHPDVWPHLGSIPAPLSCGAGLETAQEPARLRTAGMERQGWGGKDGAAGIEWQGWSGRDAPVSHPSLLCRPPILAAPVGPGGPGCRGTRLFADQPQPQQGGGHTQSSISGPETSAFLGFVTNPELILFNTILHTL